MKLYRVCIWSLLAITAVIWAAAGRVIYARLAAAHSATPPAAARPLRAEFKQYPTGIVIHHSATGVTIGNQPVDAAVLERMHAQRHFPAAYDSDGKVYHIGYHYVVLPNGVVQPGRPEHLPGHHTRNHPEMLGICLVGDFNRGTNRDGAHGPLIPPPAQLAAAAALTRQLLVKYELPTSRIFLHRDLVQTACPGDMFPREEFMAAVGPD